MYEIKCFNLKLLIVNIKYINFTVFIMQAYISLLKLRSFHYLYYYIKTIM